VAGGFAISDTAAHIVSGLGSLEADVNNIKSITATNATVTVGVSTFTADEAALNKVVGGFDVLGQSSTIAANFDALAADVPNIDSIAFSNASPVLNLTSLQAMNDASLLAKVTGSYVLGVGDGGSTTTGVGDITMYRSANYDAVGPNAQAITLAPGATGTITLSDSKQFAGEIAGLAAGDEIDLKDIGFGTHTTVGFTGTSGTGLITVTNGSEVARIALLGNYLASTFVATSDGHGGTLLTDTPQVAQHSALASPTH
jgi:hypothetical protein